MILFASAAFIDIISELLFNNTFDFSRSSLLGAFVILLTMFKLLFLNGSRDSVELNYFCTLISYVVSKSSDIDIWEAVFDIIYNLGAFTPPLSIRSSLSRFSDSETCNIIERELFFEIRDCTFCNKKMLEAMIIEYDGNRWKLFLSVPAERPVWDWLYLLEDRALSVASGIFEYKHVFLTRFVRGIFIDQPTRRFVYVFTFSAFMMELWVFDRSGVYSSGAFNIYDKPDIFARAIVGYATMDDNAMGLDMFIEREGTYYYVILDDATNGNKTRIRLLRLIVRQKAIVCRGTICYETQDSNVAKFSWASDKRKLEVEQLRLAETRGITTIAELREGLAFRECYKFRNEDIYFEDLPLAGTIDTLSYKRKSLSDHWSNTLGSKKPRSNSRQLILVQKQNSKQIISTGKPSLYDTSGDMWENRIYSCLVISLAGRVISDFRTIKELLGLLYKTGNILYRDISLNNIIIIKPEIVDGFNNMFIDFNLVKFIAVEVLRKTDYTYRYNLESFFYVLLWIYPPKESILRRWEVSSFKDIARNKAGDITVDGLEGIMGEFPELLDIVKPLCLRIRKILFPLDKDERMSFGTPVGDPN
ncbi:serine/threonine-protein kinase Sgk2 [Astrocystis sublimbata]|nr:serine/threonine-protein kinase Sgk2 [Astrocystis sublimbata]